MKKTFLLGLVLSVAFNTTVFASTQKTLPAKESKSLIEISENKELIDLLKKTQNLNSTLNDDLLSNGINNESRREVLLIEELELNNLRQ